VTRVPLIEVGKFYKSIPDAGFEASIAPEYEYGEVDNLPASLPREEWARRVVDR